MQQSRRVAGKGNSKKVITFILQKQATAWKQKNFLIKNKKMTPDSITLTETTTDDLHLLFEFQLDEKARYLAAFTAKDTSDKAAYLEKYAKHLADPTITMRTIKTNGAIVGSVAKYMMEGDAEITYGIDKKYWRQGIATAALAYFLKIEPVRPIFGRVAFDNYGSQKVLEKCGFIRIGSDKGFANARQAEIEEFIYKLD